LHVGLHEVLRVGLEDLVDLVEQVVEFGLQLLARLGDGRGRLVGRRGVRLVVLFDFWVRSAISASLRDVGCGDVGCGRVRVG